MGGRESDNGSNGSNSANGSNGSNGSNGLARSSTRESVAWAPSFAHHDEDARRVDFAQIWAALRDGRRTIALITVAATVGILALTLVSRMTFVVSGSLYMGDLKSSGGMLDVVSSQFDFGMDKGDMTTEIEILNSRRLMQQAVLASGLNTTLSPGDWNPPRYLNWRLGHRDLRGLEGASRELRAVSTQLTGSTGTGQQRNVGIKFTSYTDYDVLDGHQVVGKGTLGKPAIVPGLELTLTKGPERSPSAGSEYTLEVYSLDDVLDSVSKDISITAPKGPLPGSEANIVHLELSTKNPFAARSFLDELIRAYLEQNLAWKTAEAESADKFLTNQLQNTRASLDKALKELAEFKKKSSTIDVTEEAKSMIGQVAAFEQQRVTARLQVEGLQQVKTMLAKGDLPPEAYMVGEAVDSVFIAMGQGLVKAQMDYKAMAEQFTPDYPPLKEAKKALDAQLKAVQNYVDTRLKRAQDQLASLDGVMTRYAGQMKALPDAELKLVTLTQESEVYGKLYEFLLERQQQAEQTKASTISRSRVLDPPAVPSLEDSPKLKFRLPLGVILGVFLGIGFVLLRWQLATAFRSESEARKALEGFPLFASVPRQRDTKGIELADAQPLEILAADLRSPFAEAFRLLRTNLYYSGSRENDKVVLLSSPGPGDGKTVTTLCLAGILAADGKRVLVVDGDMRKPSHHLLLRQPQHPGLSGILTNEIHWSEALRQVKTPFGEFSSIATGIVPPNPAELLSSPHLQAFLAEARTKFDLILLDSPPFPIVSDALVLSHSADRVLSIVRIGVTHRRVAQEHVRRLSATSPHYGLVLNDVTAADSYGYGYGYAYGYGYGEGANDGQRKKSRFRRKAKSDRKDPPPA